MTWRSAVWLLPALLLSMPAYAAEQVSLQAQPLSLMDVYQQALARCDLGLGLKRQPRGTRNH